MAKKLKIVYLDNDYCDYLRMFDSRVPYNMKGSQRPFVGVLLKVGKCLYFAPLSSPRPKHLKLFDNIDLLKIEGGKLGVINFNNMVPVYDQNIKYIDTNQVNNLTKEQRAYLMLLNDQLHWLRRHEHRLFRKSKFLYDSYMKKTLNKQVIQRCCDFSLLEEKCKEYNSDKN